MARLIFRGRGWYSDFRVGSRRIQRFLHRDKREAAILLGRLIEQLRGESAGRPDRNIGWSAFKSKYLEYSHGNKRPSSIKRDKAAISSLEKSFHSAITRLDMVTPELLERWKAKRLADGKGKPTINRDVKAIKALLHKAEAWGYLTKRDWRSVKQIKTTRRKLYFYTPKEVGLLLGLCRGVWRTICLLGARAGLRREEMHTLTWEDVDFNRGRIHICPKEGWEPKDYEQRFIGMSRDLRAHLLWIRSAARSQWVLQDSSGVRPALDVMSSYFRKLSRKAGLKGSIHILRHTFASHLAQSGVDLKRIKDLLGHSSMETTEVYAELSPEHLDRAVQSLPDIPDSASGPASGDSVG